MRSFMPSHERLYSKVVPEAALLTNFVTRQVTSYVHGGTELLGVQIDAAINSGNSGIPSTISAKGSGQVSAQPGHFFLMSLLPSHNYHVWHAGGPVFNGSGQCVGIAFQSMAGSDAENIGAVHPLPWHPAANCIEFGCIHSRHTGSVKKC